MADKKISACAELSAPDGADVLPIIDSSESADANKNKKITLSTLFNKIKDGSAASPSLGWSSDAGTTGIYRSAAHEIGFGVNTNFQGAFYSGGLKLGSGTAGAQLHLFSSDTTDQVIVENTDAGVDTAPDLVLFRNSSSPAANDNLGLLIYRGEDSAGNATTYAEIGALIQDTTNGSEDGILDLRTMSSGTSATRIRLQSQFVGIHETSPLFPLHVSTTATGTCLRLECAANDAASGADLTLFRHRGGSTAGVNNDLLGTVYFRGKNNDSSSPEQIDYASIEGSITDITDEAEDGRIRLKVQKAGTITTQITIESTGVTFAENVTLSDAKNIVLNTTTGTKIGTATSQKLGLWNVTPVVQPSAIANLNAGSDSLTGTQAQINLILAALRSVGIIAT